MGRFELHLRSLLAGIGKGRSSWPCMKDFRHQMWEAESVEKEIKEKNDGGIA